MRRAAFGFSRVEALLVLGCLLGLGAVMVPASQRELAFGRNAISHATMDPAVRELRKALKEMRLTPRDGGYGWFAGKGELPKGPWKSAPQGAASLGGSKPPAELASAIRGQWRGPYAVELPPDAFGRAMMVTPFGDPALIVWCLSAGANGLIETTDGDLSVQGDDAGVRIR